MLRLRRKPIRPISPFAFPGVAPGFDPSHVACRGGSVVRFSGVAMAGSFVEVQQGAGGILQGTANATMDGRVGPAVRAVANGEYVKFSGLQRAITTAENNITLAGIFSCGNGSNISRILLLGTSTLVNTGWGFGMGNTSSLLPYMCMPGQGETNIPGLSAFVVGHSYFFVCSTAVGGVINAVVVDLTTGVTSSSGATASLGGAIFPTDGNYGVGASPNQGGGQGVGSIAAACHINRALSLQEMLMWAQDPWSFWYPR